MSTNIITGFEIVNELTITDGLLTISTNDTTNSLDISGNLKIGTVDNETSNKLIIENTNKSEINLISKNSIDGDAIHKISNKNGMLMFENENTNLDYTSYEFDVGGGSSVGIIKSFNDNESGLIFGKNSSDVSGVQSYKIPHVSYLHDSNILSLTSENIRFNLASEDYSDFYSIVDITSNGLGISTLPLRNLHVNAATTSVYSKFTNSESSTGIDAGLEIGLDENMAIINNIEYGSLLIKTNNQNRVLIDMSGNMTIGKELDEAEAVLDISGDVIMNSAVIKTNLIIDNAESDILLDVSGVGAIKIPAGNNDGDKNGLTLNSLPGYLRYNTTLSQFEGYDGTNWGSLGGVSSIDQNTRIDSDDTNGLSFVQNSNIIMTIKDSNIGIGETNPNSKLMIKHNQTTTAATSPFIKLLPLTTTNNTGLTNIFMGTSTAENYGISLNAWRKESNENPFFCIKTHDNDSTGVDRFYIDKDGNIGIGTTNAKSLLDIYGSGMTATLCRGLDKNFRTVAYSDINSGNTTNSVVGGIGLWYKHTSESGNTENSMIKFHRGNDTKGGYMSFTVNDGTEKMRLNPSGRLGIGTPSPSAALEVIGDYGLKVTGSSNTRGKIVINTSYNDACDLVFSSNNPAYHGQWWFSGRDSDESNRFTIYRRNAVDLYEVMTFKYSNGNVGLGYNTDPHYQLTLSESPSSVNMPSGFADYNKMSWFGAGHFGGWNGNGGVTIGRVTDTRNDTNYGTHYYNSIQSSWSSSGSIFCINPLGGKVGIYNTKPDYDLDIRKYHNKREGTACNICLDCENGSGAVSNGLIWKPLLISSTETYTKISAAVRFKPEGDGFVGGLEFLVNDSANSSTNAVPKMRLNRLGWLGIGTEEAIGPLSITSSGEDFNEDQTLGIHMGVYKDEYCGIEMVSNNLEGPWIDFKPTAGDTNQRAEYSNRHGRIRYNMNKQDGSFQFFTNKDHRFTMNGTGYFGIGITEPVVPLEVKGTHNFISSFTDWAGDGTSIADVDHKQNGADNDDFFSYYNNTNNGWEHGIYIYDYDNSNTEPSPNQENHISAYFHNGIMVGGRIYLESDERIKNNIRVINDTSSLKIIRNIQCYSYFYNDILRRDSNITFGFLAQEVKKHLPSAIKTKKDFLPSFMTLAKNIIWEILPDNKFKMTIPNINTDINGNSRNFECGTKFKFYISDIEGKINFSDKNIVISELLEDKQSFIVTKKSEEIFIYGPEVNDFHILDKEKIWTLHHSAMQQLDKNQQKLQQKVQEQNTIIFDMQSKIEMLMGRITQLEQMQVPR